MEWSMIGAYVSRECGFPTPAGDLDADHPHKGVVLRVQGTADAPALAEADNPYKQWTVEEVEACAKVEQDVQMGEETAVELSNDGAVKMSHMEVLQPAHKHSWQTVAESDEEPAWPKIHIPHQ
ncbi:hypothetical protein F5J12DRAFT_897045 [Pisolithus orientalis]|uniref:uncharacterized protein n=1 Tax=Pisolithus orientalis TaxID=936130 RepID=UPI002223F605|nr:uncharacterized protein F5J12DRAFT_897045 [Pisolithus orientalis]KAI5993126.1 hypothetical protein F5J12DRAFT_897045 [Pisolithus orientalis]